jgi:hypothetical protein
LKPARVNSSLSVHVANDRVDVEVADDIKIRPRLLIMSLVTAKTQELISSDFQCDWSIVVLIRQSGRADAITVFLHIVWNGKPYPGLRLPAIQIHLIYRRDAEFLI